MIDDDGDAVPPEELGHEAIPRGGFPRDELDRNVKTIAAEFPHLQSDDLLILLVQLQQMRGFYRSQPSFDSGQWSIPKDLPNWKVTRAKLRQLERALDKAVGVMRDGVSSNPSFRAALAQAAPHGRLDDQYIALLTLHEVALAAGAVDGSAGNRPLPAWTEKAARLCAFFWNNRSATPPTAYFTNEGSTCPANDFSKWFCQVMKFIDPLLTPSTCDTILRNNRTRSHAD